MDVKIINTFIDATVNVIRNFAQIDLSLKGRPTLIDSPIKASHVTAIIGINGAFEGNLFISMHSDSAAKLAGNVLGMELTEDNGMIESCIGEIANMVGGTTITKLSKEYLINITPPTIIKGDKMKLTLTNKIIAVNFGCEIITDLMLGVSLRDTQT